MQTDRTQHQQVELKQLGFRGIKLVAQMDTRIIAVVFRVHLLMYEQRLMEAHGPFSNDTPSGANGEGLY